MPAGRFSLPWLYRISQISAPNLICALLVSAFISAQPRRQTPVRPLNLSAGHHGNRMQLQLLRCPELAGSILVAHNPVHFFPNACDNRSQFSKRLVL
jgi:hypothetical protein